MNNSVTLSWKEFNVPTDKLNNALKEILLENYDGLVCEPEQFYVIFKTPPTQPEIDTLTNFWNEVTEQQFSPTLREIISNSINEASVFGRTLILDAAVENVEMGITQAGKTREVADYCADIQRYLESGSLYAATAEIDELILAGVPAELSPFITQARLEAYKQKIEDFLAS